MNTDNMQMQKSTKLKDDRSEFTRRSALGLVLAGAAGVLYHVRPGRASSQMMTPTLPDLSGLKPGKTESKASRQQVTQQRREQFFGEGVEPLLDECLRMNGKAIEAANIKVHELFEGFCGNTLAFSEDMNRRGTRFRIMGNMVKRLWRDDDPVRMRIELKFREHFFSEESLSRDITGIMETFLQDVERNRMNMLSATRAAVEREHLNAVIVMPDWGQYARAVELNASLAVSSAGTASVVRGVATLAGSEAGAALAMNLVRSVLARLAAQVAIKGGQTAAAAGTGAGAGTVAGPLGTVVGLIIGLLVGIILDLWMTKKSVAALERDMKDYFNRMEQEFQQAFTELTRAEVDKVGLADRRELQKHITGKEA